MIQELNVHDKGPKVRLMAPVAGMDCGYSWWEITTPRGMAYEMAYSAEQALQKFQFRPQLCTSCGTVLGDTRWRWYGGEYCSELCLARGKRAQWETSREDRYWSQMDEYGAAELGSKP